MEKTNSRIRWRDALGDTMTDLIKSLPRDGEEYKSLKLSLQDALLEQTKDQAQIRSQRSAGVDAKSAVPGSVPHAPDDGQPVHAPEAEELFDQLLDSVAGLVDKEPVTVEVISPLIMAEPGQHVEDLLAGEFLAHFGGFVDEDLALERLRPGLRLDAQVDGASVEGPHRRRRDQDDPKRCSSRQEARVDEAR